MIAKHAQVDHGAHDRVRSAPHESPAEQVDAQSGAGPLMFLVAALFAGSTLISLTLLWFAVKGIGWLLLRG